MRMTTMVPVVAALIFVTGQAAGQSADLGPGVTITVESLKRAGSRAVRLDFNVRNTTGDRADLATYGRLYTNFSLRAVSIIDYDGGFRYGALMDSEGNCACSRGSPGNAIQLIQDGEAPSFFVMLTAPPEDVGSVSIDFGGAALIDDVPIEP